MYAESVTAQPAAALLVALLVVSAKTPTNTTSDIPRDVMQELYNRGCKLPTKNSNRVIRGEFFKPGQVDWAALCITKKTGALLVFPNGSRSQVEVLETQPRTFSVWSISLFPKKFIAELQSIGRMPTVPSPADHDGINSFLEYGDKQPRCLYCYSALGETRYCYEGQWAVIQTVDTN